MPVPSLPRTLAHRLFAPLAALVLLVGLLMPAPAASQTQPAEPPVLHLFWSLQCPVCIAQKPWIDALEDRFPGLTLDAMELSRSDRHHARFVEMAEARGIPVGYVPTMILGERAWIGDTPAIRAEIEAAISAALAGLTLPEPEAGGPVNLPIVGEVDIAGASLVGLTVLIAFVDGFNPCSVWVLTLLLGMVIASGSRQRVAVVGITFLLTTATIYGAFIAGVFNVLAFAFALPWVRWAVALFALGFGLVSIKDYFAPGRGPSFSIPEGQKPGIYARLRRLRQEDLTTPGLIGATVAMAAGIALVELPCTAGFPVLWSGLLADRGVSGGTFWGLLAIYVLVYLGIELVIFFVALTGMSLGRMGEGQGRVLKLIGGAVMVALAGALALRPSLMEDLGASTALFAAAMAAALLVIVVHRRLRGAH